MTRLIKEKESAEILTNNPGLNLGAIAVPDSNVQMVIIQFTAIGFIEVLNAEDKDGKHYKQARLTETGLQYLINASAAKRGTVARARATQEDTDALDEEIDVNDL